MPSFFFLSFFGEGKWRIFLDARDPHAHFKERQIFPSRFLQKEKFIFRKTYLSPQRQIGLRAIAPNQDQDQDQRFVASFFNPVVIRIYSTKEFQVKCESVK